MIGRPLPLTAEARDALIASADGDGRFLLNQAETLFASSSTSRSIPAGLSALLHRRVAVYDKDREGHYNLISALHKAIRGSDPQAALYYLARMLVAGEEPLYVLRRLIRAAVGGYRPRRSAGAGPVPRRQGRLRFPRLARRRAGDRPGLPLSRHRAQIERRLHGAEGAPGASAQETGSLMPPKNILNAPTKLMKDIGYGKGYHYDHDAEDGFSGDNYWPEEMEPQTFYEPTDRGFEKRRSPSASPGGTSSARRSAMTEPIGSWDEAVAFALTLPDTELSTSYGKPAVKVNGRAFLYTGHEDKTSFGVAIDLDTVEMLKETDPDTFWQTPHYEGWPAVLIRFGSADPERVRAMIERSRDWTAAKPKPRPRKKK